MRQISIFRIRPQERSLFYPMEALAKTLMKPEHRKERTFAGRHHLAQSLILVRQATRNLEDAAQIGTQAELLRSIALWNDAVERGQAAARECEELLGEEVEDWLQAS